MEPGQCGQGPGLDIGWRAGRGEGNRKRSKAHLDDAFLLRGLGEKNREVTGGRARPQPG